MKAIITVLALSGSTFVSRDFNAADIVGVTRTTTGGCGSLPERVECSRIFVKGGRMVKVLAQYEALDAAWVNGLRNGESTTFPNPIREEVVRTVKVEYSFFNRDSAAYANADTAGLYENGPTY